MTDTRPRGRYGKRDTLAQLAAENYTMLEELRALRNRLGDCEEALQAVYPLANPQSYGREVRDRRHRLGIVDRYMSKWGLYGHDDDECPCCGGTGVRP